MKVGIVGLPNAGKSSLFNALTRAGAEAANYPFTTIEPNVAVVPVADDRLERIADVLGSSEVIHDTVDFHDIAGLVAGAHRGEGLGNRFLSHIRETDAIVHVVRVHGDEGVVHPEGRVDPVADIATIETELVYADLEQAERRLERVEKTARGGERPAIAEEAWLREVIAALQAGRPARTVPVPEARRARAGCPPARSRPSRCCSWPTWTRGPTRCPPRWPSTPPLTALGPSPYRRGSRRSWPSSTPTRRRPCAPSWASPSPGWTGW